MHAKGRGDDGAEALLLFSLFPSPNSGTTAMRGGRTKPLATWRWKGGGGSRRETGGDGTERAGGREVRRATQEVQRDRLAAVLAFSTHCLTRLLTACQFPRRNQSEPLTSLLLLLFPQLWAIWS